MASRVVVRATKASRDEVATHRAAIRQLAAKLGLENPRVREDGTVVVHTRESGYRAVARLSAMASEIVGNEVHVISDDVPGAANIREL